jgi:hypothetical protein
MRRKQIAIIAFGVLVGIGLNLSAYQIAELVLLPINPRFHVRYAEVQNGVRYSVMVDTKQDSGNTCFLFSQSLGLGGQSLLPMPQQACQ